MAICGGLNVINFRLMCYYCNSLSRGRPIYIVLEKALIETSVVLPTRRLIFVGVISYAASTIVWVDANVF